ncbi:hypothetical protein [Phenylobacterium sp.]|uniref:hypothetical protein n=1 Tax=Phenylobacterium sp. TaxID=1871053 RepID=UPI002B8F4A90|nr:hypothetical protein [Phenylobacterium sp.]HVI33741.1 hypothetical protein [Phenylobacterium sp.]
MNPEHAEHDALGHERRLAEALGALVQQGDISDYRDSLGHPLTNNLAFRHAQSIVEKFGVTHEDICEVLDTCGDDGAEASRRLVRRTGEVRPADKPPEYRTWTTGP